jgi:hypothetical protein
MAGKTPTPGRVVRAVTDVMWNRDQLQMRAIDALLSGVDSKPARQRRPKPPGRAAKKP